MEQGTSKRLSTEKMLEENKLLFSGDGFGPYGRTRAIRKCSPAGTENRHTAGFGHLPSGCSAGGIVLFGSCV
ncbi:MAG: hypothetical protein ACYSSO_05480 [Planctomycetota bacterium]